MPLRLKAGNNSFPPGGFPFTDSRTGKTFDAMSADLTLQAKNIIKHRQGNPRIYPRTESQYLHLDAVKQEILEYICAKRPAICAPALESRIVPQPAGVQLPKPAIGKKCYKCGSTDLEAQICKTCSGMKIKSWLCKNCGTSNPK